MEAFDFCLGEVELEGTECFGKGSMARHRSDLDAFRRVSCGSGGRSGRLTDWETVPSEGYPPHALHTVRMRDVARLSHAAKPMGNVVPRRLSIDPLCIFQSPLVSPPGEGFRGRFLPAPAPEFHPLKVQSFCVRVRAKRGYCVSMLAWSIALVLVISSAIVGWYVGAIRVAITTVALFVTLFFLQPLSSLCAKLLGLAGVEHAGWLGIFSPLLAFGLLQIIAKSISKGTQAPIENYYKYKASDTQRLLFERFNQRCGPCLGVVNGTLYFILIGVACVGIGYTTIQISRDENKDSILITGFTSLAKSYQATGISKVVGPYIPAPALYYEVVDLFAEWFHQPLVQSSLATYPPFIPLSERKEFQEIATDVKLQEFLARYPTIEEMLENPKLAVFFNKLDILFKALDLVNRDLTDIAGYIRTGKSEKYDGEKILGRWDFDLPSTVNENKKLKRMSGLEVNKMRGILTAQIDGSTLLATIDNKVIVRRPLPAGATGTSRREGTWKSEGGGKYTVQFPVADDKQVEMSVTVDGRRFQSALGNYAVFFDKW